MKKHENTLLSSFAYAKLDLCREKGEPIKKQRTCPHSERLRVYKSLHHGRLLPVDLKSNQSYWKVCHAKLIPIAPEMRIQPKLVREIIVGQGTTVFRTGIGKSRPCCFHVGHGRNIAHFLSADS